MTARNIYSLAQAGYTAKGNPQTIALSSLRRRARSEGVAAKWLPSGFNRNGIGEFMLYDTYSNTFIGTAPNESELREWLIELLDGAERAVA
jgi:hypothetical protein